MKNQEPTVVFDQKMASSYDERWAKLAPTRDALHLLIRLILSDLPADARILCVGVGTGSELIYLAEAFTAWHFTAVDPATAMLDICRQRAEASGIASRCTFHDGYLDSLPATDSFDAATCLLVSQFILQREERREFFREIASRLRIGGYLINADITSDTSTPAFQGLLAVWLQMMRYTGVPEESLAKIPATLGRDVTVLPRHEIEAIIAAGGFEPPVLFSQSLLIHSWYSRRMATD
ncbi:MAG: class I SAM-dependent methyltransferase [Akkermansiaceae bacterium]|nr:class I SAM-dependent methyltransferase [Armatimonadota bacterium]